MGSEELKKTNFLYNNFKQYVAGNTYNGVALTVTGTGWTNQRGVFIPYKTLETSLGNDSAYRLKFNIWGTISGSVSFIVLTVSGTTFKNLSGGYQAICSEASQTSGRRQLVYSNNGNMYVESSINFSVLYVSGEVELESAPTWMDTIT